MKIKLLKNCVLGVGKTGEAGKTVEVSSDVGKQLIRMGRAELPGGKKSEAEGK